MNTEEKLEYNKRCAEFLGASIIEEGVEWKVKNWKNQILSITPLTMWGTKEETYQKVLFDETNERYGRWGGFSSDWNMIMEVVEAIEKLKFNSETCTNSSPVFTIGNKNCYIHISNDITESRLPKGGKYYYWSLGNLPVIAPSKKEAVVQAINQFLLWYNKIK